MLQTLATIGVLLGQMQNGKEVVISYRSRQLTKVEGYYSTTEHEVPAS